MVVIIDMLGLTPARMGELGLIQDEGIVRISQQALAHIDSRLIEHGDRVAFIACEMLRHSGVQDDKDVLLLFQLAIYHDIGAYKIDEIAKMLSLDAAEAMEHAIYGYLFLRYLSPLGEAAKAVLYHHTPYNEVKTQDAKVWQYAQLIQVADAVDVLMLSGKYSEDRLANGQPQLDPQLVKLFLETERTCELTRQLHDGSYRRMVEGQMLSLCSDIEVIVSYLSMLVYIIDFKSAATVDHTINAVAYAVQLGKLMGLPEREQYALYLGALVHDIGKIAIPHDIIENPGRLTTQQMEIMKTHVVVSDEILKGNISDEIRYIAVRHHEKPDGSGYHHGLHNSDLTVAQRVMAVADVMSALLGRRSYKESYDTERCRGIISTMAKTNKLDAEVCRVALLHFDEMVEVATAYCAPVIGAYHNVIENYQAMSIVRQ